MTAAKEAKALGIPSLKFVIDEVGCDRKTIYNWYNKNYTLFSIVIHGVAYTNGFLDKKAGD